MSAYDNLSDEDKLELAIQFVARGSAMPEALTSFLHEQGLFDVIVNPTRTPCQTSKQAPCAS